MKLCLVSSAALPTPPARYGGLEAVVYQLARELVALGHDVTLFALRGSQAPDGAELVEFDDEAETIGAHEERLLAADLVHWQGWSRQDLAFALRHPAVRTLWTLHGAHAGYQPPPPNLTVCGISRYHAWAIGAEMGTPCPFVHNGVDLGAYPLYDGPRGAYLAYMARLSPEKGLHYALDLAASVGMPLRAAGTEHHVADAGYVRDMLARFDQRGRFFEGDLGMERKVPFLQRATAVVAITPTFEEPFGLYAVEAMACGTPVVALTHGAPVELIEDGLGGVVIHHPDEFAEALDRARAIPPQFARQNAERYSSRAMAEGYVALYERILGGCGVEWRAGEAPAALAVKEDRP